MEEQVKYGKRKHGRGAAYRTVEQKIRSVVASMGEHVGYVFGNWAQVNVSLDGIECPTVVYVAPPSGTLEVDWREVRDRPSTQIGFVCNTEFDYENAANDNVIERMKMLFAGFVKAYNASGLFEVVQGELSYRVLYDHLDQNVTGILVEMPIEEIEGIDICAD